MKSTQAWTGLFLLVAAACAAAERAPSMPEVVRQRTGIDVSPLSEHRAGPSAMSDTVRSLLAGELTVDRATRVALLNNRTLQAELEEIGISKADLRQALLPKNPMLEGEVRFGSGTHKPGELIAMQDLTSILLIPQRRRAAGAAVRRATLRASHAALELVAETRSAFHSLQGAEQTRSLWERTVAAAQTTADLARRQHEAGNITDLDLENEQASYEGAKIELARAQTEALAARERLNQAMGAWGDQTHWQVTASLPQPPDSDGALDGLEAKALANRLDLAAAETETHALAAQVPLARYSQFPELRAGVHVERDAEGNTTTGPAVELAVPLFDRGQQSVARTKAQLRQAEDRHLALAASIQSEVRMQRDKLVAARELVEYYRDVVLPRRGRIVKQTQLEFNAMLIGLYQLLQSKQAEVEAERNYIEAQRDYWVARAELERALGGPLP